MIRTAVLCLVLAFATGSWAFGNQLVRSAGAQSSLPITIAAARADGWMMTTSVPCDPTIGQAWNKKNPYPTKDAPITLYFAGTGQLSGFGTDVFGTLPDQWVTRGYYRVVGSNQYRIQVATRSNNGSSLCTANMPAFSEPIGDRIIINPSRIAQQIPPTESDAQAQKWTKGACIDGMGTHWEYDLVTAPIQSYNSSNLLPVVPMYYQGKLNAVFFASTDVQQGLGNHQWDVIPIPGFLMCKNFCGNCNYSSVKFWSTMHIWFGTTSVKCVSAC